MRTGIIVARFQCSYLHEGHIALIRYAQSRNEQVVVFLGTTQTRLTKNNPLNYNVRKAMVLEQFPNVKVHEFPDQKYDTAWDSILDNTISELYPDGDIILYGSRDSFVDRYKGKYRTELFTPIPSVSSTRLRAPQYDYVESDPMFRQGIIYASGQKYPTSYQAIDVAIVDFDKKRILLGKKKGEPKFRVIGGFVDVEDESLEAAGKREVREEGGDIETDQYEYIGSFRINDWRYRGEQDKIMTALFCCRYIYGRVEARDDIFEVQWFDLSTLTADILEPEHEQLFTALKTYLTDILHLCPNCGSDKIMGHEGMRPIRYFCHDCNHEWMGKKLN